MRSLEPLPLTSPAAGGGDGTPGLAPTLPAHTAGMSASAADDAALRQRVPASLSASPALGSSSAAGNGPAAPLPASNNVPADLYASARDPFPSSPRPAMAAGGKSISGPSAPLPTFVTRTEHVSSPIHATPSSHIAPATPRSADHPSTGFLERWGAHMALHYHVDTNRFAETGLLVLAAVGVSCALYRTNVPALRKPAFALLEQTVIAVSIEPLLLWLAKFLPYERGMPPYTRSTPSSHTATTVDRPVPLTRKASSRHRLSPLSQDASGSTTLTKHQLAVLPLPPASSTPSGSLTHPVSQQPYKISLLLGIRSERYLRKVRDQGIVPGLLLCPLLINACLLDALRAERDQIETGNSISALGQWSLPPWPQGQEAYPMPAPHLPEGLGVLSSARLSLSAATTLIYIINVIHLVSTHIAPRSWVSPRSRLVRARNVGLFYTACTIALVLALPAGLLNYLGVSIADRGSVPPTGGLAIWEVLVVSVVYQVSFMMTVLLGPRNFSLAELIITVTSGTTLVVEALNLIVSKFVHNPVPHTARPPSALLIYQLALIVGTFSLGFLTSPLLWLSRSLAQRPTHRLRWPEKRHQNRKLLSASFTILSVLFIGGILGPSVQWFLHSNPWIWAIRFALSLETLSTPPNSVPWNMWSSTPHLRLASWWAACLTASIVFWWWVNGGMAPSTSSSSNSFPSSTRLAPPAFSARRCFGHLRLMQKRAMSSLTRNPRKRRSFNTRPRLATGTSASEVGRVANGDPSLSTASMTPVPQSHGSSTDSEPDPSPPVSPHKVYAAPSTTSGNRFDPAPDPFLPSTSPRTEGDLVLDVNSTEPLHESKASSAAAGAALPQRSPQLHSLRPANNIPSLTPTHQPHGAAVTTPVASSAKRYPPVLSLNAKRKFFHLLAVLLFVPGFILDPTFVHLALSVAFAAFILCEYIRFFALYPLGAPLHVFLTRFIDNKDTGPVLLSPFYLLIGCALPLWIEVRPSALARSAATLAIGVADATASAVGQKLGKTRWPQSSKTVEGTLAFVASLSLAGWVVHAVAPTSHWSWPAWLTTATALGLLEGTSDQNDNLILPIFSVVLISLFQL